LPTILGQNHQFLTEFREHAVPLPTIGIAIVDPGLALPMPVGAQRVKIAGCSRQIGGVVQPEGSVTRTGVEAS
jgi:hypothetical protein